MLSSSFKSGTLLTSVLALYLGVSGFLTTGVSTGSTTAGVSATGVSTTTHVALTDTGAAFVDGLNLNF